MALAAGEDDQQEGGQQHGTDGRSNRGELVGKVRQVFGRVVGHKAANERGEAQHYSNHRFAGTLSAAAAFLGGSAA
jgi:hypothetical protein